jgi:CheY-like chemotaxis protein
MRVILVEDQALLRQGLAGLFRDAGHDVVASLGDCDDLKDAVREHAPDVVVLDVRLPPSFTDEGTRAAAALKSTRPDLGVVLLSQHIETAHSVELAGLGGFGYLLKDRVLDVSDFLSAVGRVADGGSALDPSGGCRAPQPECPPGQPWSAHRARARGTPVDGAGDDEHWYRQAAGPQRTDRRGPRPAAAPQTRHRRR